MLKISPWNLPQSLFATSIDAFTMSNCVFQNVMARDRGMALFCEVCLAGMLCHEEASATRSPRAAAVPSEVRKAAADPRSQLILAAEIWLRRPWNSTMAAILPSSYWSNMQLLLSRECMNSVSLFPSESSLILFLMTGADHHHVHFRLSEWLGGARLPLCSKGSHHPVSAAEKRCLASSHHQPLQRHSVRFCLGSQLQLLERCLPPSHSYMHAHAWAFIRMMLEMFNWPSY